jgi:hypothetical protein
MFDQLDTEDQKDDAQKPTDWSGTIIGIATAPVFFFFSSIGKDDIGFSASICVGMFLLVIRIYWKRLKTHLWFWVVILVLLTFHIPLILKVQWPHIWISRVALLPIGLADLLIYVGVIKFVERFIVKSPSSDEET